MLIIYSKSYCHALLFMLLLLLLLLLGFVCTWGVCMVPLTSTGLCPTPFIVVKSISTLRNLIFRRLFTLIWWQLIQGRQLNSFSSGLVKTIPLNWLLVSFFFLTYVYLHNLLQCLEFLSLQIPCKLQFIFQDLPWNSIPQENMS